MDQRHYALTPHIAGSYREAVSVCFNRHHSSPIEVALSDNGKSRVAELAWLAPDARTSGAWANEIDATEAGAYACVIAAVELMRNFYAVRRCETGTGADYYIGPQGSGQNDLEECLRLEELSRLIPFDNVRQFVRITWSRWEMFCQRLSRSFNA